MINHELMIEMLGRYYAEIKTDFEFQIDDEISPYKIDNALNTFAAGTDKDTIIGFYDTTVNNSGKNGYLFTDTKVCYLETLEKPQKLWYDDIKSVGIIESENNDIPDCKKTLCFTLYDESEVVWKSSFLNKTPLYEFFMELLSQINISWESFPGNSFSIDYGKEESVAGIIAGTEIGNREIINKLYDEEKFHAKQGHGFAAERANHFYDKITGHKAEIIGDDNAKNGSDRIVDGIEIQTKYWATAKDSIDACFEESGNGEFRYYSQNGSPMKIEVPYDQYDEAVDVMKGKILRGQIKGVNDPEQADNIVRRGHVTYEQAKNIAKPGNIDSVKYDAEHGAVISLSALGLSAMITFAVSLWNGEDFDGAMKAATYSGLKVGGTTFVVAVLASQLSKTGLNSALVGSSEAIIDLIGPKASAFLVNAYRSGSKIYGSAAMKSAAKLLRGTTISVVLTAGLLSTGDVVSIFRGRISRKQLFKNLTGTGFTVAGGTAGGIVGAAIGSVVPGPGTVLGAVAGSMAAGAVTNKATNAVMGAFIEDDADAMIRIIEQQFCRLATDYLLNQKEAEKTTDQLREKLNTKILKDMYASEDRVKFACDLIVPLIEKEILKRRAVVTPTNDKMNAALKEVLEEISEFSAVSE